MAATRETPMTDDLSCRIQWLNVVNHSYFWLFCSRSRHCLPQRYIGFKTFLYWLLVQNTAPLFPPKEFFSLKDLLFGRKLKDVRPVIQDDGVWTEHSAQSSNCYYCRQCDCGWVVIRHSRAWRPPAADYRVSMSTQCRAPAWRRRRRCRREVPSRAGWRRGDRRGARGWPIRCTVAGASSWSRCATVPTASFRVQLDARSRTTRSAECRRPAARTTSWRLPRRTSPRTAASSLGEAKTPTCRWSIVQLTSSI